MTAPLPRYALIGFTHYDRHVKAGEEVDGHDELVELRPGPVHHRSANPGEDPQDEGGVTSCLRSY